VPLISLECVSAEMYEMWALRAEPEDTRIPPTAEFLEETVYFCCEVKAVC